MAINYSNIPTKDLSIVNFKVHKSIKAKLFALAKAKNLNLSQYLRHLVFEAIKIDEV